MPNVVNPSQRGDLIVSLEVQPPPHAQAKATDARSQATSAAKTKPKKPVASGRVRQAIGLAMTSLSLLVLTAQLLMLPSNGWLLATALATILLAYGVTGRALWAVGGSLLAAAGGIWLMTQADLMAADALRQAWILLPIAVGVGLLGVRPK
jgi:4-hydroxybenzoate polyprenyltransferase